MILLLLLPPAPRTTNEPLRVKLFFHRQPRPGRWVSGYPSVRWASSFYNESSPWAEKDSSPLISCCVYGSRYCSFFRRPGCSCPRSRSALYWLQRRSQCSCLLGSWTRGWSKLFIRPTFMSTRGFPCVTQLMSNVSSQVNINFGVWKFLNFKNIKI